MLGLDLVPDAIAQGVDLRSTRPQPGDQLVFAEGTRKGEIISVADIQPGGPQVPAFAFDSRSKLIRDGSRLNKILLVRSGRETLISYRRTRSV